MTHIDRSLAAALLAMALHIGAAGPAAASPAEASSDDPAKVDPIEGTELSRITLTQQAATRLDIQTGPLHQEASGRLIAPYASVLYDLAGAAWVYTNPTPLTYVRQSIVVDLIQGDDAFLKNGPPAGTQVVTVGVPELYGVEKGVGE